MFEKLVMDGLTPMDPPEAWVSDSMLGLLEGVRSYDNSPAAIGYTVYYYANDMEMAQGLKVLKVDGVAPSAQSIRTGTTPSSTPTSCPSLRTSRRTAPPASCTTGCWAPAASGWRNMRATSPSPIQRRDRLCAAFGGPEPLSFWPLPCWPGVPCQGRAAGPPLRPTPGWRSTGRCWRGRRASPPWGPDGPAAPWRSSTPSPDYGELVPYAGAGYYLVYPDGEGGTVQSPSLSTLYGLMTVDGCAVLDPVCTGVYASSYLDGQGTSHTLPVWELTRTDPEAGNPRNGRLTALAARDGSWVTPSGTGPWRAALWVSLPETAQGSPC